MVLFFKFFVIVPLLRVQFVESLLVLLSDVLDLLFVSVDLSFSVSLLREEHVEVGSLLVVLVLNVHEKSLDVFRLGVAAVLVKGQVVVCQLTFVLPHVLDKRFVLSLEIEVSLVVLVDLLDFCFHLLDLVDDVIVLVLQQVVEVRAVVDLSTWTLACHLDATHTVVSDWPVDGSDLRVVAHALVVGFLHGSWLSHGGAHAHRSILVRSRASHLKFEFKI